MPGVGFETWFPKQCPTVFVVKNIASENKRIKIFNVPIANGLERDLLAIPWVSEADIRHSLLKGELLIKLKSQEAIVTASNIDLVQFDECQKEFLRSVGITEGLDGGGGISQIPFIFKQGERLTGIQDGINRIFYTSEKFINGTFGNNEFKIMIKHNGRVLNEGIDYVVAESGGTNSGFDMIIFKATVPEAYSVVVVDYVVEAPLT